MPSTSTRPSSGGTSPRRAFISVDLPAPFAPRSPVAGSSIVTVTPSSAWMAPYRLATPSVATRRVPAVAGAVGEASITPAECRGRPRPRAADGVGIPCLLGRSRLRLRGLRGDEGVALAADERLGQVVRERV